MTYPSQSLTERWISMIVAEGGEVPTSFGLGELMQAYADAEGGGGGGREQLDQTVVEFFDVVVCGAETTVHINPSLSLGPLPDPSLVLVNPLVTTFVAPASGNIEIEAEATLFIDITGGADPAGIAWCFGDAATGTTPQTPVQQPFHVFAASSSFYNQRCRYHAFVELTPGNTYNWQLSGASLAGNAADSSILADDGATVDDFGPAVITVWAA